MNTAEKKEMMEMIAMAVAAATPAAATEEAIVPNEEMAARERKHNTVMRTDIANRKEKLYGAFDFGKDDKVMLYAGPADRRQECFSDVVGQACWGIANGAASQYMWHRMLSDNAYLKMSNLMEENGGRMDVESLISAEGVQKHETGMEPNRDYLATERNYSYHITTAYAYEVNMYAAYEIWKEIQDDKATAFYERNAGNLDAVYTNKSRAPNHDISDTAYTSYLEKRANKDEQTTLKQGQHAMQAARLLRLTRLADEDDTDTETS
jgi:hypothetical protein